MRTPIVAVVTVLVLAVSACSTEQDAVCSRVVREDVADDSLVHVIPGADVEYASDPPTSGPHSPGPAAGVYDRVLTGPEQVGILERGDVLVQYRPGAVNGVMLETLVDDDVVLAPNPGLPAQIVVTAWAHRMECRPSADQSAIATFIAERKDQGPSHP